MSELEDDISSGSYLALPAVQIARFSPTSSAILEIRSERDRDLLEKLYSNGVLLGDQTEEGWGIQYAREFDMTNDSDLFPPRPEWEEKGYLPDEYGHWLKGGWRPYGGPRSILERERDLVLSADGLQAIRAADIQDVALPLYEGRMIGQFDFSEKGWVSGKGRTAIWEFMPRSAKTVRPQFLMDAETYFQAKDKEGRPKAARGIKLGFMDVSASTNTRTMIASLISDAPCGNKVPVLRCSPPLAPALSAILNSFAYDFQMRRRLAANTLNFFILEEANLPLPELSKRCAAHAARLGAAAPLFAPTWLLFPTLRDRCWANLWAVTDHERLRIRCILDAAVAAIYGLSSDDFRRILRDCDSSAAALASKPFTRTLDPKAFWRVEKEKPPERRHTVLSQVAFHELERIGLDAFLALNEGDGWMLPEKLRLADYGLGHDERAKEYQPVASVLGPRFYDWQLAQSVEQSWEECERHAELLAKIVPPSPKPTEEPLSVAASESDGTAPTDLFGNPIPTDLFGNPVYTRKRR